MPPQQQQGGGGDENSALWLSALTIVALVIIWFTLHQWITFGFFKLKLWEIYLLKPFTQQFNTLIPQLQSLTPSTSKNLQISDIGQIGTAVGQLLRYPLIVLLIIGAALLYFGSIAANYRTSYTMQELAKDEEVDWPQISPVVPLDLVDTPIGEGPWAMALNPMQFCKKNDLLIIDNQAADSSQLSSAIKVKVSLKRFEAKQAFLMQLGNYWHSLERLPIHVRALIALFAAKAHDDQNAVIKFNNQIAVSATKSNYKNIDFSGLDQLLAKHFNAKDTQAIIKKHAFVYTILASLLEQARTNGVYASSDFLWLKPIDRRLWYTLNCVGRKTPFSEVAGIYAHRNAELIYNKPLYVPMVDEAVDALELAITDILFKPNEEHA